MKQTYCIPFLYETSFLVLRLFLPELKVPKCPVRRYSIFSIYNIYNEIVFFD